MLCHLGTSRGKLRVSFHLARRDEEKSLKLVAV